MRFAISIPQFVADGTFDPASFRAYLTRAEALGFESAWTMEQVLGTMPVLSPLEMMTYAAACTERLRLGCVVFVTPLHNPVHLAKALSSLDQLSRGRIEVGVGTGGKFRPFAAFDADASSFIARFNEGLQLMKSLWIEPQVTFDGRFWRLENASMEPKPFQKPHPPIWFGANHPNALKRAVTYGDGFFGAGSSTTEQFAKQVPIARAALEEQGRDPSTFQIAKRVYIVVDDDAGRARQRAADELHKIYAHFNLPQIEAVAVYGPPADCVEGVRAVIEAGAELVLFSPLANEAEQMERLAAEVMPRLG